MYIEDNTTLSINITIFPQGLNNTELIELIQQWILSGIEVSSSTAENPFIPNLAEGETVGAYTTEDILYVHDQQIRLDNPQDEPLVYVYGNVQYVATIVFYGGSGGVNILNNGYVFEGAQTFSSDQVMYSSASGDGPITLYAGIISQGSGQLYVGAARVPDGENVIQAEVSKGVQNMNSAFSAIAFSYDNTTSQIEVRRTAIVQDMQQLALALFDSSTLVRNDRQSLALGCLSAISNQIANDLPDEFWSPEEAEMRLGLTALSVDEFCYNAVRLRS